MARATATLTSCGDAIFRLQPSPELLAAWAAAIPDDARSCDPERQRWWFAAEHVDRALALAERYADVALIDGPHSRSTFCPCQGALHQVRQLAGVAR